MISPGGKITVPALHSTKKVYKAEELTHVSTNSGFSKCNYLNAIRKLNSVLTPVSSKTSLTAASLRFSPIST
jgi:hypothetical protein